MPAINILTKPASSACNMACKYCFYHAIAEARTTAFEGMLAPDKLEALIQEGLRYGDPMVSFAFQGGEPTLAGLPFFRRVIELQKQYNTRGIQVHNALQTNGYVIDEEWAQFLAEAGFLVGLSLDGPAELHNLNRIDNAGKGTFNRVMRAARVLEKYKVPFNILCVVTGKNARSIERIYRFYRKQGFGYLQFIPCLEPIDQTRGQEAYHLSTEAYGQFLIRLFDLWYEDLKKGDYVSIRHLDNWLSILFGQEPEACNMRGRCSVQYVVEGDGGVYPCDFYVFDEWRLGTLGQDNLETLGACPTARRFLAASEETPPACRACRYLPLCRGGCRRDYAPGADGQSMNYYCGAYRAFFAAREREMVEAARLIEQMRMGMR